MADPNPVKGNAISRFFRISKNILREETAINSVTGLVNKHRLSVTNAIVLENIVKEINSENDQSSAVSPLVFHKIFKDGAAKEKFHELLALESMSAVEVQLEMKNYYESVFCKVLNTIIKSKTMTDANKRSILFNVKDKHGKTLLHYAIYNSCWTIIEILLQNHYNETFQLNFNIQDNFGRTPLNTTPKMFFSKPENEEKEEYLRIFRLLVHAGSDLFIPDLSNELPWRILQNHGFDETDFFGKCCEENFTWFSCFYLLKDPLRGLHQFIEGKCSVITPPVDNSGSLSEIQHAKSSYHGHHQNNLDETADLKARRHTFLPRKSCAQESHFSLIDILEKLFQEKKEFNDNKGNHESKEEFQDYAGTSTRWKPSTEGTQQRDILKYLVFIYCNIHKAAKCHLQQKRELMQFCHGVLISMIENVFLCESMEDPLNVQLLLHRTMFTFDKKEFLNCQRNLYEYAIKPDKTTSNRNTVSKLVFPNKQVTVPTLSLVERVNEDVYKYEPLLLIQCRAFGRNFVLDYALKHHIKFIFNFIQISNTIDDIFYKSLRCECRRQKEFYDLLFDKKQRLVEILMEKRILNKKEILDYQDLLKTSSYQIRPFNNSYYEIYRFFTNLEKKYHLEISELMKDRKYKKMLNLSSTIVTSEDDDDDSDKDGDEVFDEHDEEQRENIILDYHTYSMNLRFAPWLNFLLQCMAKVIRLFLIIEISVNNYSENYGNDYSHNHHDHRWTALEYWLLIIVFGVVIFEIGSYSDTCNINKFTGFFQVTNIKTFYNSRKGILLDWISIAFIVGWATFRIFSKGINFARVLLAIDAIPQTLSLLRFLAFYKPLGELIFSLKEITKDIFVFGMFYSFIIAGFGTTIYCLYHTGTQFPSVGLMFLTLFEYSLQDFDFTIFNTTSTVVNTLGILTLMSFLILISLVLVNLFIARLSFIYDKVHRKATSEWSFTKSHYIARFIYLKEVHPFCMLPPPFNLITSCTSVVGSCYTMMISPTSRIDSNDMITDNRFMATAEKKKKDNNSVFGYPISVAGTVANFFLSFSPFGTFIRIFPLTVLLYRRILNRRRRSGNHNNKYSFFFWIFIVPYLFVLYLLKILFSFISPLFYYRKHVEEVVDSENKEFVFIHLFSLNNNKNRKKDIYNIDSLSRKRTPSLARSFSSSKHFERTLSHMSKDGELDDEEKENGIRMHTIVNPISSSSKTIEPFSLSEVEDPGSSNDINDSIKKKYLSTNSHSSSSTCGNLDTLLELDCYPETNHKLFNEQDIANILKPLKGYFDKRERCLDDD
jgi:hypothetical protein